jgi:hypothetical protein
MGIWVKLTVVAVDMEVESTVAERRERGVMVKSCIRMSIVLNVNNNSHGYFQGRAWRISRLMFSNVFALIPPDVMLARQSNRSTSCISAPDAIISSIAVTCAVVLYDASKSNVERVLDFTMKK